MRDLSLDLATKLRELVEKEYPGEILLRNLVNDVINEETDFEHIITFLDESTSSLHRGFANILRETFESVLRERLSAIEKEQSRIPDDLYFALLDMHSLPNLDEELAGMLTLNYDGYLESAVKRSTSRALDVGIALDRNIDTAGCTIVLKLHGSFDWSETWPVSKTATGRTLWIPPGIQKAKERYPFNLIWGLARELLDCDVLRVVGCRLSSNDWDLISLLFSTQHTNASGKPYRVELIDSPKRALELQSAHPYLGVQSILELDLVGDALVGELTNSDPRPFSSLTPEEQRLAIDKASNSNWFMLWLKHRAESMFERIGTVTTNEGAFARLMEAY